MKSEEKGCLVGGILWRADNGVNRPFPGLEGTIPDLADGTAGRQT